MVCWDKGVVFPPKTGQSWESRLWRLYKSTHASEPRSWKKRAERGAREVSIRLRRFHFVWLGPVFNQSLCWYKKCWDSVYTSLKPPDDQPAIQLFSLQMPTVSVFAEFFILHADVWVSVCLMYTDAKVPSEPNTWITKHSEDTHGWRFIQYLALCKDSSGLIIKSRDG